MKYWIHKNLHRVLVVTMAAFLTVALVDVANAQGRKKSDDGKSESVEKRSKSKGKAVTSSKGSSRTATSKKTTTSSKAPAKRTVQKKSSSSSRVVKRGSSPVNNSAVKGSSSKARSSTGKSSKGVSSNSRSSSGVSSSGRSSNGKSVGSSSSGRQTSVDQKRIDVDRSGSNKTVKTVKRSNGDSSDGRAGDRGGNRGGDTVGKGDDNSGRGSVRGGSSNDGSRSGGRISDRGSDSNDARNGGVGNSNGGRNSGNITLTRDGNRSRYTGPVFDNPKKAKKYKYNNKHKWEHTYFRPDRVHVNVYPRSWHNHVHISSHVHLGLTWPWQYRVQHNWRPRYRYRQVIYVNVGWGRNMRRSRIDVRTYYNQRVAYSNADYAEIEIDIDAIELYQDGRFIGYVDKIPSSLREINAVVYANGRVEFDRNVFLVGDTYRGFEMISTRYYDDYLLNAYSSRDGMRVGRLDLRKERVKSVRRSRLFNSRDFNGNVPYSLLPEDDRLFDYSYELFSYGNGRDGRHGSGYFGGNSTQYLNDYEDGMARIDEVQYSTSVGASVDLTRESFVERIDR